MELIRREILKQHPEATGVNAVLIDFFLYDLAKEREVAGKSSCLFACFTSFGPVSSGPHRLASLGPLSFFSLPAVPPFGLASCAIPNDSVGVSTESGWIGNVEAKQFEFRETDLHLVRQH